ncbi:MAG: acyl-CoA reductase [Rhodothermales bacterium]
MSLTKSDIVDGLVEASETWMDPAFPGREQAVEATLHLDNRFTYEAISFSINQQMSLVTKETLLRWFGDGPSVSGRRIGALVSGNIPFVGFHDFAAILLSRGSYVGGLSSRSPYLLPAFAETLRKIVPIDCRFIDGVGERRLDTLISSVDGLIATGTGETMQLVRERCDEAGLSKLLARRPSFSVAVLDGRESDDDLEALAEDVLLYDGLGCRSVTIVFAPESMPIDPFLNACNRFRAVFPAHERTTAELRMNTALLEAAGTPCAYPDDHSFLISRGDAEPMGPGHVRWVWYGDVSSPAEWIGRHAASLQIVVSSDRVAKTLKETPVTVVRPGEGQRPPFDWEPDGISVLDFLRRIETSAEA